MPQLLSFLKKSLPEFSKWMEQYKISDDIFVRAPRTGEWFWGESDRQYVEYTENEEAKNIITKNFDSQFEFLSKHKNIKKTFILSFLPYLQWGRKKTGKLEFILSDEKNNIYRRSISYGSWSSNLDGSGSRANLLKKFPVLKLGQVRIPDRIDISRRNLDFTDLDFLEINGDFHGSSATIISFSSCRELTIKNGGLHHVTFNECVTEKIEAINSRLQDFIFNECVVQSPTIINCTINGFTINGGLLSAPIFEKTEIQRFNYMPEKASISFSREFDVSRRLRIAFQSIGKRAESKFYYYRERCFERKTLWSPYLTNRREFPKRTYAGRLSHLYRHWRSGHFSTKKSIELLLSLLIFHFKIWLYPKYFVKSLQYKVKYIISLFEYLIWGYGERPSRIVLTIFIMIALFSYTFYLIGPTKGSVLNSVYFSTVTFTTLGYGDIQPGSSIMKVICGIEALLGALSLGLLIGGIANKSRY